MPCRPEAWKHKSMPLREPRQETLADQSWRLRRGRATPSSASMPQARSMNQRYHTESKKRVGCSDARLRCRRDFLTLARMVGEMNPATPKTVSTRLRSTVVTSGLRYWT